MERGMRRSLRCACVVYLSLSIFSSLPLSCSVSLSPPFATPCRITHMRQRTELDDFIAFRRDYYVSRAGKLHKNSKGHLGLVGYWRMTVYVCDQSYENYRLRKEQMYCRSRYSQEIKWLTAPFLLDRHVAMSSSLLVISEVFPFLSLKKLSVFKSIL